MPRDTRQRDAAALRDMLCAMSQAAGHIAGLSRDVAGSAPHPRDAALYRVLVLGEAATRVSDEFKVSHPEVPWADIIGMRNVLIHGYEKVNWDVVWGTIHNDFPVLERTLKQLAAELS